MLSPLAAKRISKMSAAEQKAELEAKEKTISVKKGKKRRNTESGDDTGGSTSGVLDLTSDEEGKQTSLMSMQRKADKSPAAAGWYCSCYIFFLVCCGSGSSL